MAFFCMVVFYLLLFEVKCKVAEENRWTTLFKLLQKLLRYRSTHNVN